MLAACGSSAPPTAKPEPPPAPTAPRAEEGRPTAAPAAPTVAAPTPTPPPPTPVPPSPTPRPPRGSAMSTPDYSVHVFLWGAFETTIRDLGLVTEMGFGWVKQRF